MNFKKSFHPWEVFLRQTYGTWSNFIMNISRMQISNHWLEKLAGPSTLSFYPSAKKARSVGFIVKSYLQLTDKYYKEELCKEFGGLKYLFVLLCPIRLTTLPIWTAHQGGFSILTEGVFDEIYQAAYNCNRPNRQAQATGFGLFRHNKRSQTPLSTPKGWIYFRLSDHFWRIFRGWTDASTHWIEEQNADML